MFNPFQVLQMLGFQLMQALAFMRMVQRGEIPGDKDIEQFSEIVCNLHDALEAIKPTARGAK